MRVVDELLEILQMEKKEEGTTYSNIFKSTILFSFVQVIRILTGVIKNKVVAILLGAEGMGIMSIYQNTINFIKTGAGLGISQSAIKDISEANASKDNERISRTISIVLKVVMFTSLLGAVITVLLSPILSKWEFGNCKYSVSFAFLGIAVFFEVFVENQLAILKGMRQLRNLAKASVWGAVVGLLTGIPLYYILGVKGIVPSFIITAFVIFLVTRYYVSQVKYNKICISFKQFYCESAPMVKMGASLMFVSLIGTLFALIITAYLRSNGGLSIVGYYNAGEVIVGSYIGVIISAMSTDYYPRISAINNDNKKLTDEVNRQSEVGLLMAFPLVIIFVFFSPIFINILYTSEFQETINYTDFAIIGSVIIICSNCMGMILLAKQASSVFLVSVISQRILCLAAFILLYSFFGLRGLGYAYIFLGLLHFVWMSLIMMAKYEIRFNRRVIIQLVLIISVILLSRYVRGFENAFWRFSLGFTLIALTTVYSYLYMKRYMDIDLFLLFKSRIKNGIK